MSHIAKVSLEVKDLGSLQKAAHDLGLEMERDTGQFRYYAGRKSACDHTLRVKGNKEAYEIGVIRNDDGKSYRMEWDNFAGGHGLCDHVGKNMEKLKTHYAKHVTMKLMRGYSCRQSVDAEGRMVLRLSR